ncbi:hypothetical protein H4217_006227 [Coemansia sp. RSA 1939]|nr:hypothetical protein H4217_006227 [Coemansia sp. RSA 1939]KAJ2594891.1 hypothetical protein EV177_008258 [Coemansia sp. RSA 1804]KAJ2681513.1 hypothetical protein GGH99_005166 [Coemansia sp. RSA 1285]
MKISTFVYTLSALAPALVLGQDSPLVQQAAPADSVANPAATVPDANVVINNQALPPGLATPPVAVDGAQSPVAAAAAADSPTAGADANPVPTPAMDANAQPLAPSAVNVGVLATQPSENNNNDQALLDTPVLPSADSQMAGMMQPQVPNPSLGSNGLPPVESDMSASISDMPLGTPTESSDMSAESAESGQDSDTGFETFGASSMDSDDSNMESDESEFGSEASEESELGSEESGSDDFDSESDSDDSAESDESDSTDSDDLFLEETSHRSRERDSSSDEFDFSSDEFATDDISSGNTIVAMGFASLGSALCLVVGAGAFF